MTTTVQIMVTHYADGSPMTADASIKGDWTAAPKSLRIREMTGYGYQTEPVKYGWFRVDFTADGVNGGKNETGIKRFLSLVKCAEKNGWEIVQRADVCRNRFATLDEALAAMGG